MINYHPSQRQLEQFVEGTCSPAWSLVISAHVDMCKYCQEEVNTITVQVSGEHLVAKDKEPLDDTLLNMMGDIMDLDAADIVDEAANDNWLELDGRKFEVPRALARFVDKTDSWSRLVGKLWQAPVDLGEAGKGHFIYMEKGGGVPEHTHRGNELTLVINGEFEDGHRCYDSGDFILMNQNNTHTPISTSEEGCLVFSFVEEPLHFTSGLARLLNPFSHLFFK